jgi:hypothetical protein
MDWNDEAWERHKRLSDDRTLVAYGSASGTPWLWYSYPTETVWLNRTTAEEHRGPRLNPFYDTRLERQEWPIL